MAGDLRLPVELAPSLRAAAVALVDECGLADRRRDDTPGHPRSTCHRCHRDGRLGGHHLPDWSVVFVHRSCHRRLHRHA